ncbi:hypothetical protein SAMN06272781_6877 [Streptomyces sp. 1222.2]|uniref:hypothetical protein n=1 Tax=Streptomyces sp. 1222.2 TaxID=1938833 RepID=UPI000BC4EE68|nr:hypothetical protein [Streptomyces sp. 1222.2]SOD80119.1 hypothetical protein SAMN06272781_6877 [Streptomyces sp. 1222.2]
MASFSDDFNRPDSSDLGAGWVEVSGDWSIVSGQLSPGAAGGTIILRAAGAMASDDNYAQVTIAATAPASQGVWCRGNATISSGYLWRNDGSEWVLFSVVGGSFTALDTYAAAAAPGDMAKVQAVGSTIKGFVNGVERVSLTNTHVTTGVNVGIRSESAGAIRFDDFTAADVTVGATLGTATASETAQQLAGSKAAALDPALEAEAGQALAGAKAAPLPAAAQTETAQPLVGTMSRSLGPAASDEAAQPLTGSKSATIGRAAETGTARPLAAAGTPDVDIDVTVGAPYSGPYTAGAPHAGDWEVGEPW